VYFRLEFFFLKDLD